MSGEQVEQYEKQVHELQSQVKFLEEETRLLRRRLTGSPRQVEILEEQLVARETAVRARRPRTRNSPTPFGPSASASEPEEEVEKRAGRPLRSACSCGRTTTARGHLHGRAQDAVHPRIRLDGRHVSRGRGDPERSVERRGDPRPGRRRRGRHGQGAVGDDRVIVSAGATRSRSRSWRRAPAGPVRAGDPVLFDPRSGYAPEKLPREEVEELVLEEIPSVTYEDIGGLSEQIETSATPWSCRSCTPSCSTSTSSSRRRACCCTDHPGAARR